MELQVGNVIWYDTRKYKVVSRKENLAELRQCGLLGFFKENRQIFVRRSTKYHIIK
jgi:hypothetical protein